MDFSNITQQQWLVIGGAALIFLILGWLIGYLPGRGTRKQLETKLKTTSQNLAEAQALAAALLQLLTRTDTSDLNDLPAGLAEVIRRTFDLPEV